MTLRRTLTALLIVVGAAACSSASDGSVEGLVIDLDGDLSSVASFTLRLADGTDRVFEAVPGILFHDRAPLSHLRDHLVSGEPVRVRFRTLDDGTLVAFEVDDAAATGG